MTSDESPLYNWQSILCYCLISVSATLSFLGSSAIIAVSQRKLRSQTCYNSVYQRLMILVSSIDMLADCTLLVGPWLLPPSAGYPMAKGNDITCTLSGIFVVITGIAPCIAGCYLNLYFLMTTKYGWRERDVKRNLEIPAYAFGGFVVLMFVVVWLSLDLMTPNPVAHLCSPLGEGRVSEALIWSFTVVTFLFAAAGIWATYGVYKHVQGVTDASRVHDAYSIATGISRDPRQKRVQRVATRSILYTAALLNTLIWPTVYHLLTVYTNVGQEGHRWWWYSVILIGETLFPLQGFFNFFIYIQSRASAWKKSQPELSVVQAAWWAVSKPTDPPCGLSSRLGSSSHSGRRTSLPSAIRTLSTTFHISYFLSIMTSSSGRPSIDAFPRPGGSGPIAAERRESGMGMSSLSSDGDDNDEDEFAQDSYELPLHQSLQDIEAGNPCMPSLSTIELENPMSEMEVSKEGRERGEASTVKSATYSSHQPVAGQLDSKANNATEIRPTWPSGLDTRDGLVEKGTEDIEVAKAA